MAQVSRNELVWTEAYSVGVKKIDQQHQELFRIVNELLRNQDCPPESAVIGDILQQLSNYADYHFKTEELIMREYGYPEHATQVSEHTAFRLRTARFCKDAMTGKTGLPAEMLRYLQDWLKRHILNSDVKFKDFLLDNGFPTDV
jgi:hemerythrin-like metal-binding protein